jgi:hypothetical protein
VERGITTTAAVVLVACMISGCTEQPTAELPTVETKEKQEEDEAPEITGFEPDPIDSEFWNSANLQLKITRTGHGFFTNQEWTETTHVSILLDEEGSWEFTGVGWGLVEGKGDAGGVPVAVAHETECTVMGRVLPDQCALEFLLISDQWLEGEACVTAPVVGTQCGVADADTWCWGDQNYFDSSQEAREATHACHLGHWVVRLYEPLEFEAVRAEDSHWVDTFEVIGVNLDDLPEGCIDMTLIEQED